MTRNSELAKALDDLAAQSRDGAIALFSGPSGTGKTLAAQSLADALRVPLVTANLAKLINKYIGETEKHIDALLKDAKASGAVLLFDEADALFGKRTDVKDSHDKYANMEVSHLLQRVERNGGIVILTSNHRDDIDASHIPHCHCVLRF